MGLQGQRRGKQNHVCSACDRQLVDRDDPPQGYSKEIRQGCLGRDVNSRGFRRIERSTGAHDPTVVHEVEQLGQPRQLPPSSQRSRSRKT